MKTITLTPGQVQNFIHFLDGDDCPPLLSEFYCNNLENVFKKKKNWVINTNTATTRWLKKELKGYIKFLSEEIEEVKKGISDAPQYWQDEAKYHKIRIKLAERTIAKLI